MASLVLSGDTSGSITVSAPAVSGSNTQTLAAVTGTLAPVVSGTAVTASGTSIDFTSIPSWAKRITVMFSGVSLSGSSNFLIQIGSGSFTTSGYVSGGEWGGSAATSTAGFLVFNAGAANTHSGLATIDLVGSNIWVESGLVRANAGGTGGGNAGTVTLGGALDRVRITTVNGTDTFDAGTINILYE